MPGTRNDLYCQYEKQGHQFTMKRATCKDWDTITV